MNALTRCERCGSLIAIIFPIHYCKPNNNNKTRKTKPTMRSDKEIEAEIARLKSMQPFIKNTVFSSDNVQRVAAQIEVLEKRMTPAAIEREWYQDETAEEYQDGDNDVWAEAGAAQRWMTAQGEAAPSADEGWGSLAKSNGWKPPKQQGARPTEARRQP